MLKLTSHKRTLPDASCVTAERQSRIASGKSLNLKFLTMLNKLKRSRVCKDALCPSKEQPRAAEAVTVDSDSTLQPPADRHRSVVVARGISSTCIKVSPRQEQTSCAKGVKTAPIFLRTTQHRKSKHSGDGRPHQSAETLRTSVLPPQSEGVQQVRSRPSHLTGTKWSPSALHSCLEEIRTANPAFPVPTVFSTLLKKSNLQDSGEIEQQCVVNLLRKKKQNKNKTWWH